MNFRDENDDDIVIGMSRTLYLLAYADHVENQLEADRDCDLPRPGPGEDWDDYAGETPRVAFDAAWRAIGRIEQASGANIWSLYYVMGRARREGMQDPLCTAETFGSRLAHMYLGTGVCLSDDYRMPTDMPIVVPHGEFYLP